MSAPREGAVQASQARDEAVVPVDAAVEAEPIDRWSPRTRFLFIVGAAALCWIVPGVAIYLLIAQY
jgi:hypothetical protein